ncbi:MAG: hypothetical protein AAGH40_12900 [Verrucomicrobiota bacterium]
MKDNVIVDKLKRYPLALISFVCWIAIIVVIFMRGDALENLEGEESELSSSLRLIEGNAVSSKDLENQVEKLEADVKEIEGRLFNKERRAINTDYLYSFEEDHDIAISNVKISEAEDNNHKKGGPNELKVNSAIVYNVSLSASYQNFIEYIYSLYKSDAFIRIADLDLTASKDTATNGELRAQLRILVLSEKD